MRVVVDRRRRTKWERELPFRMLSVRHRSTSMILRVFAVILMFWAVLAPVMAAEQRLRFTAVDGMRRNEQAHTLLSRAYAYLGLAFDVIYLTPNRSIQEVENGTADGELLRSRLLGDHFTEIVRVDVPVLSMPIYAYTSDLRFRDHTLDEMKNLRVGHVAGALFAEKAVAGFLNVTKVEDPEVLFDMLQLQRIDIAIAAENPGDLLMEAADEGTIYRVGDRLMAVDFYHYLNRRHKSLVPLLEEILVRMNKDQGEGGFYSNN